METKDQEIENTNAPKVITKKLKVSDYIFRFEKRDLCNAVLEYKFDKAKDTIYNNGKITKEKFSTLINILIHADDKNQKTYTLDFTVNLSVDELNNLSSEPNNINDYIVGGAIFWEDPYKDETLQLDCYFQEKMYYDNPNFYVAKLEENKFSFKISIPEECIFIWFNIDF